MSEALFLTYLGMPVGLRVLDSMMNEEEVWGKGLCAPLWMEVERRRRTKLLGGETQGIGFGAEEGVVKNGS